MQAVEPYLPGGLVTCLSGLGTFQDELGSRHNLPATQRLAGLCSRVDQDTHVLQHQGCPYMRWYWVPLSHVMTRNDYRSCNPFNCFISSGLSSRPKEGEYETSSETKAPTRLRKLFSNWRNPIKKKLWRWPSITVVTFPDFTISFNFFALLYKRNHRINPITLIYQRFISLGHY